MTGSGTPAVTADREWTRGAGLRQRILMAAIYFVADSLNYLVAGSLDRTDLTIGTFTRHGDAAVDLLPLGQLLKSEVMAMAGELQVPPPILEPAQAESLSIPESSYTSITGLTNADLERYLAMIRTTGRSLFDRDTAPGAEPEEVLAVKAPSLLIPGDDPSHATSAAHYLRELLPNADFWNVMPPEQTTQKVCDRILEFCRKQDETSVK